MHKKTSAPPPTPRRPYLPPGLGATWQLITCSHSRHAVEMESRSRAEWEDEVDDEPMEDARVCDGMSAEESERIDVSLLDEEDEEAECDSAPVADSGCQAVVDLSQDDDEGELIVDLSQDDGPAEQVSESHHPPAVERGPPSSPAVVRVTGLHAALAKWLQAGLTANVVNCAMPKHEEWGALVRQASHDQATKKRVLFDLYDILSAAKARISGRKEVVDVEVQRCKLEIRVAKRKLHDDAIRELDALGHDDHESEGLAAFVRQVQGPDGDRVRQCEISRDRCIVRKAEEQAQLGCVDSMLALIELERLRVQHTLTTTVNYTEDSQLYEAVAVRVASEMDVYAVEFETRWALAPAERRQLLAETTEFWNAARFWLPEWVRELAASKLESIPVEAAKLVLVGLAADLYWSQALVA